MNFEVFDTEVEADARIDELNRDECIIFSIKAFNGSVWTVKWRYA